ncbi:MAG: hypothetical protein GY715_19660 [Planctomycetes bacterium]|nr:hypothetical protein [Planctomycetota bacterium]
MKRVRAGVVLVVIALLAGCGDAGPPRARTSFLQNVDLVAMTDSMARSFASDPVIGARSPDSERWIVSIHRVANYTNQVIPDREKWLYVGRLRAVLQQSDLAQQRNLVWIIPPERWPIVAEELGVSTEPYGLRLDPTHLMTAEFHALTNTSGAGRSDAYLCDYQLVDLQRGTITWEDRWEVKRTVHGRTYD